MVGDLKCLLRQTFRSSGIVLTIGLIATYFINSSYCIPFLMGSVVSILNFSISGIVTEKAVYSELNLKGMIIMLSFLIRIVIVAFVGLTLLKSGFNVILYVIGYMSNFISLFIAIKYEERK